MARNTDSSLDRMLALLDAFTEEQPSWTADGIMARFGLSRATAYRYLKSLLKAGLLAPAADDTFIIGPRILQLDRQIRLADPLVNAGSTVVERLRKALMATVLLCCCYGDAVLCMDHAQGDPGIESSYTRGRPMPLFRGATSKIILANLPAHQLRKLMLHRAGEVAGAGLGESWPDVRARLKAIRRAGYCIAKGEVDPGATGIAAPIFQGRSIAGSLSVVLSSARFAVLDPEPMVRAVRDAAAEISRALAAAPDDPGAARRRLPSPRHLVVAGHRQSKA